MTNLTEKHIRLHATPQSYQRGESLQRGSSVHNLSRVGNTLVGRCEGSMEAYYNIRVTLNDDDEIQTAACSCPYDWGGICKHIVALLLTYLDNPETVPQTESIEKKLDDYSKEELLALVKAMLEHYPDLAQMLDQPTVQATVRHAAPDIAALRQELQRALDSGWGWGYDDGEDHIRTAGSIERLAMDAERRGEQTRARLLYTTIIEEYLECEYFESMIEDDLLTDMLGGVAHSLEQLLNQPAIHDDETERQAVLNILLTAYIWDIDFGGISLFDGLYRTILDKMRPEDHPMIRSRIQEAMERKREWGSGDWARRNYASFLMDMDRIEQANPDEILQRLRDQGMHDLVFEQLVVMERIEEALSVYHDFLDMPHTRTSAIQHLIQHDYKDQARSLAEAVLEADPELHRTWQLEDWLTKHYRDIKDHTALLALQRRRLERRPTLDLYIELKADAEAAGQWDTIRPAVIAVFEDSSQYRGTLVQIHMHEERWDDAWATLDKAASVLSQRAFIYHGTLRGELPRLEQELAIKCSSTHPERALAVFEKHATQLIAARGRQNYQAAAQFLLHLRAVYEKQGRESDWRQYMANLRQENKSLRALKDELNKAGL